MEEEEDLRGETVSERGERSYEAAEAVGEREDVEEAEGSLLVESSGIRRRSN